MFYIINTFLDILGHIGPIENMGLGRYFLYCSFDVCKNIQFETWAGKLIFFWHSIISYSCLESSFEHLTTERESIKLAVTYFISTQQVQTAAMLLFDSYLGFWKLSFISKVLCSWFYSETLFFRVISIKKNCAKITLVDVTIFSLILQYYSIFIIHAAVLKYI